MKHYMVTFSETIYVEAKNESDAMDKAREEFSWSDHGNADITNIEKQ